MMISRAYVAVLVCTLFSLPAVAAADTVPLPSGGFAFVDEVVSAPAGAFAGRDTELVGSSANAGGEVTIDARLGESDWKRVASAQVDQNGSFRTTWIPPVAGQYDFRISPGGDAARISSDATLGALTVYRLQKATWYGPGFYGGRTACGRRLTETTQGVAHRTLPCGSKVKLFAGGRSVTVPVIDRGPFVSGVVWDLTSATAASLGISTTTRLGALALPR